MRREAIARVIRAYDDPIIRAYSRGRFLILRQRFLDEIGQYLPAEGPVLDIGCGFGLFSLYYAQLLPGARLSGLDRSARRIGLAREAARRLGLANVEYGVGDALDYRARSEHAATYMLDIVHHVPPGTVEPLLREIHQSLRPGGAADRQGRGHAPAPTSAGSPTLLDLAMDPGGRVRYWPADELQALLGRVGFRVHRHLMVDFLPYPHVLYVCQKAGPAEPDRHPPEASGAGRP